MCKFVGKLKDKRGASIVIALVIFLLCALAGASAFLMAASNAGRYSHSDEQEYYSTSSAALMLVDMLDGLTYNSQKVTYEYDRAWEYGQDGKTEHTISDSYTLAIPTNGAFADKNASTLRNSNLKLCNTILAQSNALVPYLVPGEWYDSVEDNSGDVPKKPENDLAPASYAFTVTVPGDSRFGTVNCLLVMNTSYDLNFTFSGEDGKYAISVYWQATLTQSKTSGEPVYTYTDKTADGYKSGSLKQTDEMSITAVWEKKNVTISRGALQ